MSIGQGRQVRSTRELLLGVWNTAMHATLSTAPESLLFLMSILLDRPVSPSLPYGPPSVVEWKEISRPSQPLIKGKNSLRKAT